MHTAIGTDVSSPSEVNSAAKDSSQTWTYMTGIQALVELPVLQRQIDMAAGLNTAGLVSGYRGSPLGAYDQQLWKASKRLSEHGVVFQPGLNEDLAATALWGAQTHAAFGQTKVDGVFGIWYGKGPGVDRTGDVFRTANVIGTSALGGVLAVSGDDHAAQSSMYPHQTDGIFQSANMPVLQPSTVADIMELGLAGIAMSRYCGVWVALKTIAEVVESAASFPRQALPQFVEPKDFTPPAHGLNWDPSLPWPERRHELERRLIEERLPAVKAWARANRIDRAIVQSREKKLALITTGKAHQDTLQAIQDLGLTTESLAELGVGLYKVAMSWPLETESLKAFSKDYDTLLVIEEKRACIETQLKEAFYQDTGKRPAIVGKSDALGAPLLPEVGELNASMVAQAMVRCLSPLNAVFNLRSDANTTRSKASVGKLIPVHNLPLRKPYFCSGCPHNTSTQLPKGSVAGGGIGCHIMSLSQPNKQTRTFTQMGGEGAQWIGAAPFSNTQHVFQNLGDGTYQHSGILAIRAAVVAKTPITYKILFNDAVAMTGGQPTEGSPDPLSIVRQLIAEGVQKTVLVSDQPAQWEGKLPAGVDLLHRDHMHDVQVELSRVQGVTAIVYEQTCAAEKRRRRKRKTLVDPDRRMFIHQRVCEGCSDCTVQSNCIAVEPQATPFGNKRRIQQSACNKDFSCAKGFCPSFVELSGARLKRPDSETLSGALQKLMQDMPSPAISLPNGPVNILVAGVGGTGVLTTGALLGAAAFLDKKAATVLDFTGLAQKNGAVTTQVRIAAQPEDIAAVRVGEGALDVLLCADAVVANGQEVISKMSAQRTHSVISTTATPTADAVRDVDARLPMDLMCSRLVKLSQEHATRQFDAHALASALFGDAAPAQILLLGCAWQMGWVPLSEHALLDAIRQNGTAVALNQAAFAWGRLMAVKPDEVWSVLQNPEPVQDAATMSTDALFSLYQQELTDYQDARYAQIYRDLVNSVAQKETEYTGERGAWTRSVVQGAYRLMAYKDEYEVARLYTAPAFRQSLESQFAHPGDIKVWLAPPLFSRTDPATGRPAKRAFGPWVLKAMAFLAKFKFMRGTALDVFGYTQERRQERALWQSYVWDMHTLCKNLRPEHIHTAVALAQLANTVRGYGPVKEAAMKAYAERRKNLLQTLNGGVIAPPQGATEKTHTLEV